MIYIYEISENYILITKKKEMINFYINAAVKQNLKTLKQTEPLVEKKG
mgnify:CR=1 FL=1